MPYEYHVDAEWLDGVVGKARLGESGAIWFSLPEEFGGARGYFNPEELLLASLVSCFSVVSWRALQKQKVEISGYTVKAKIVMDRDAEGRNVLTEAHLNVNVKARRREDEGKILRALEISEAYCPVGRALKQGIKIVINKEISYEQ